MAMIGDLHRHILKTLGQGELAEGERLPDAETIERAVAIVNPVWYTVPQITTIHDGDVRFVWTHGVRRGVLAVLGDGRHYWMSSYREEDEIYGDVFEWGPDEPRVIENVAWVLEDTGEEIPPQPPLEQVHVSWWRRILEAWQTRRVVPETEHWEVPEVES